MLSLLYLYDAVIYAMLFSVFNSVGGNGPGHNLTSPPQGLVLLHGVGVAFAVSDYRCTKGIPRVDLSLKQAWHIVGVKGVNLFLASLELHRQLKLALVLAQNQVVVAATALRGGDRVLGAAQVVHHVLLQVVFDVAVLICAGRGSHQCCISTAWAEFLVHVMCDPIIFSDGKEITTG